MSLTKQPSEKQVFAIPFTADLGAEVIAEILSVTAVARGVVTETAALNVDQEAHDDTSVRVLLSGGTSGESYLVTARVRDGAGQEHEAEGEIDVLDFGSDAAFNTPAGLKVAFPAFAGVQSATIQIWLTRAARVVDSSWTEDDRAYGQALLAAHMMVEAGLGTGAEAEMAANGASNFKVMRSGSLTLERAEGPAGVAGGAYSGTSYGRQFAVLLRQNRGGPLITPTGSLPAAGYPYPNGAW